MFIFSGHKNIRYCTWKAFLPFCRSSSIVARKPLYAVLVLQMNLDVEVERGFVFVRSRGLGFDFFSTLAGDRDFGYGVAPNYGFVSSRDVVVDFETFSSSLL